MASLLETISLLEITKTDELKNVVLLAMKNTWSLVNPVCKNVFQVRKLRSNYLLQRCFSVFMHWNNTSTICLKVILRTRDNVRWGLSDSPFAIDSKYMQPLCPNDFFCILPCELVCIILGGYTRCDFYRIFSAAMICLPPKNFAHAQMIVLAPSESQRTAGKTARNNDLEFCTKISLHIVK